MPGANQAPPLQETFQAGVRDFNAAVRGFPGSLFAPGLGLKLAEYYQPPEEQKLQTPPTVQF